MNLATEAPTSLAREVWDSLQHSPPQLPSKFFYDAEGSRLFSRITQLPEYYLTRCELEIFEEHSTQLAQLVQPGRPTAVIELGAGDGHKTRHLLQALLDQGQPCTYVPIDIDSSVEAGHLQLPGLQLLPLQADFTLALPNLPLQPEAQRIFLLIGSTIGNFAEEQAVQLLAGVAQHMRPGDLFFIGFDLVKDPNVVLAAYNDSQGLTRAFNMNLLLHLNEAVGTNFPLQHFLHAPVYDPVLQQARSYVLPTQACTVHVPGCGSLALQAFQAIHTETSQKYTPVRIAGLLQAAGLAQLLQVADGRHYFAEVVAQLA